MIIDSNGKLFGKVSIIDALILFVILAGIAGIGYKYSTSKSASPFRAPDKFQLVFYGEEVPDFTATKVKVGDKAKETVKNTDFGNVVDVKLDKSMSVAMTDQGEYHITSRPDMNSLTVTVDCEGVYSDSGVTVQNNDFYIGQYLNLKIGNSAFYIRLYDIKKKG